MADKKIEKKRMKMIDQLETLSGKFFRYQREGKTDKLNAVVAEATALRAALLAFDEVYPPEEDYKYGRLLAIYVPYPKKFHPEKYMTEEEMRAKELEEALAKKASYKEEDLKALAVDAAEICVKELYRRNWNSNYSGKSDVCNVPFVIDRDLLRFDTNGRVGGGQIIKLSKYDLGYCKNVAEMNALLDSLKPYLDLACKKTFDAKFAELAKTIKFETELIDTEYVDICQKGEPRFPCLQFNCKYTYPTPPPKPAEPPKPSTPVQATTAPAAQKPTTQAPAKPTVSADTGPIPIIRNGYGQNTTGSVGASASDPSLPKIPSGNRFAGHDAIISRIAKDIVDGVFGHFKPVQWYQVPSQQWVLHFEIYVSIEKDYIKVSSAKGGYYTTISFVKYNMRSIPDVNMFAFAINPFIEYFAKKRAEETFGRVSYLSKYKLSFRLDKHAVSFTTDQYVFKPHFELDQYLLPSKSLNSW